MPTYATVTGTLRYPDSDQPLYARVTAHPQTRGEAISLEERTVLGPVVTTTNPATGALALPIPQPIAGDQVLWRIDVKPLRNTRNIQPWTVGIFEITANTTLHALAPTSVTAVSPTTLASVAGLADQAVKARNDVVAVLAALLAGGDGATGAALQVAVAALFSAGIPVTVYGDSFTVSPPAYGTPDQVPHAQLATALGTAAPATRGVGGYGIVNTANRMLTGNPVDADGNPIARAGRWAGTERGIVIIDAGKNDNLYSGGANVLNNVYHCLTAMLALTRCGPRIEQNHPSIAYSAGWVANGGPEPDTVTMRKNAPTAGATITITVTGSAPVWLFGLALDSTYFGVSLADFSVAVDGGTPMTWQTSLPLKRGRNDNSAAGPSALRVPLAGEGTHTIVITAAPGDLAQFDCYARERTNPPVVLVRKQPPFVTYALQPGTPGSDAGVALVNDAIALVCGLPAFDGVIVADPATGWDKATMTGPDGLHATVAGMAYIAAADKAAAARGILASALGASL